METVTHSHAGAPEPATEQIAARITGILCDFATEPDRALVDLAALYDPDVVFEDPIQRLAGRDAFIDMNKKLLKMSKSMSFDVTDTIASQGSIAIVWDCTLDLRVGPSITVPGVSHIKVRAGRVVWHRDYFDLLGGALDNLPILNFLYRRATGRGTRKLSSNEVR
jgi:limonene-1,2-epoxide hydrolase